MATRDVGGGGPRRFRAGPALAATLAVVVGAGAPTAHGAKAPDAAATRSVVTIRMVAIGDPGNAPVGVVPFQGPPAQGIFPNCGGAPSGCQLVGGVGYRYLIGELEITVGQYVAFLNTVDPEGRNRHKVYISSMSPSTWPKYGSIARSSGRRVAPGTHYSVAYPQWARKPLGFANFLRAARFANALHNGDILSRRVSSKGAKTVFTYRVRLSRRTERGMYDLRSGRRAGATRASSDGFVIPSQDEWIKAAYYDPNGGGRSRSGSTPPDRSTPRPPRR